MTFNLTQLLFIADRDIVYKSAGMLRPRGQPGLEAKLCGLGLTMVGLGLIR